jgi:hypothetical protein
VNGIGHMPPGWRTRYAEMADILIPAANGMPSASRAEVHVRWIDDALRARPDLAAAFLEALGAEGVDAEERVAAMMRENLACFDALGTLTAAAYFLNPQVRERLGYPGQQARLVDDDLTSYAHMLERVAERGPLFRPSPGSPAPG